MIVGFLFDPFLITYVMITLEITAYTLDLLKSSIN